MILILQKYIIWFPKNQHSAETLEGRTSFSTVLSTIFSTYLCQAGVSTAFAPARPCNCGLVCRKQHSMGFICKYCKSWSENVREKKSGWYRSTMDQ